MGLFDLIGGKKSQPPRRGVLDEARAAQGNDDLVTNLIKHLVTFGIEGKGPLKPAKEVGEAALRACNGDAKAAVDKIGREHLRVGAVGGFATGLGGFVTMPVSLPANIIQFYVTATRMVAAIATVRGYDVDRPEIRTAVLLTLAGADADDILSKAGVAAPAAGVATNLLLKNLPGAALMMVNKAIGFRLIKQVGTKAFAKLGKAVPVAGGLVGAGIDTWMMKQIADHARREFPDQITMRH